MWVRKVYIRKTNKSNQIKCLLKGKNGYIFFTTPLEKYVEICYNSKKRFLSTAYEMLEWLSKRLKMGLNTNEEKRGRGVGIKRCYFG